MPRHPRLMRRGARYCLRAKVPDELRPILRKREILRSLKTANYRLAVDRLRVASVEVDAEFADARRKLENLSATAVTPRTDAELHQLVVTWFHDRQQRALERFDTPCSAEFDRDDIIWNLRQAQSCLTDPSETECMSNAQPLAQRLLAERGIVLDNPSGRQFCLVVRLVHRALLEENRRACARYEGELDERCHDELFRGSTAAPAVHQGLSATRGPHLTVGQLIERYQGDPSRASLRERTREAYGLVFRVAEELLGRDTPLDQITRVDCRSVRDTLIGLPRHTRLRFPGVALTKVIQLDRAKALPRLKPKTVNNHLNNLSALFKWAVREEYIGRNPAAGLNVSDPARENKPPFNIEQLRAMFNAPLYAGCQDDNAGYAIMGPNRPRRGRFWVPLLGLWTGMRLNECCQLTVDDIVVRDGTDVILVRGSEDGEKRVKTKASVRVMPVHPELRRLGFLEHVAKMRAAGERRVFPELHRGAHGNFSDPFQKWFSRFLKHSSAARPRTSFHSFRHGFRDAMREAHLSRDVVQALGGWAAHGTDDQYGAGLQPSTLAREIAKVTYPGLDLSHLYLKPL